MVPGPDSAPDPAARPPVTQGTAPAPVLPSTAERERVVQVLSTHFANDRLSMEEFEDRLERAYKAVSSAQLAAVLADLPAADGSSAALSDASSLLAPTADVPARGVVIAVLSGNSRKGSWLVPRHLKVFAVMGGAQLDLREARFAPGVTEIEAYAVMGGVEILVPPGVRVETFGAAFMGGFEGRAGDATALSPLHPIVRLSGLAIMGGVDARTKPVGERGRARRHRGRDRAGEDEQQ
jgi:Domain of unknown function (DUF1707)/Cell wall-active antibiotics response 4TMS YvqF